MRFGIENLGEKRSIGGGFSEFREHRLRHVCHLRRSLRRYVLGFLDRSIQQRVELDRRSNRRETKRFKTRSAKTKASRDGETIDAGARRPGIRKRLRWGDENDDKSSSGWNNNNVWRRKQQQHQHRFFRRDAERSLRRKRCRRQKRYRRRRLFRRLRRLERFKRHRLGRFYQEGV